MPRILYWNIDTFSINKIDDVNEPGRSLRRNFIIMSHVAQVQPDIFVIVEAGAGVRPVLDMSGQLIRAGGLAGCNLLLTQLRNLLNAGWCLVPPLISGLGGYAEGVAVYYRSDRVEFTGPWIWPAAGGVNASAVRPAIGVVRANYPGLPVNVAGFLPPGTVVNGGVNVGVAYRQLAGQHSFNWLPPLGVAPVPLTFPGPNNRSPFYTTFWEIATARVIKLFAYHASSNQVDATLGTQRLARIPELIAPPAAGEVVILVGDFNVNLNNAGGAYIPLIFNGFQRMLSPMVPPSLPADYYLYTHMKPYGETNPFTTPPVVPPHGYPGFGYMGSSHRFPGYDSVDNILWRIGPGGAPAANGTIINPVVGSPYTATPAPAGAPQGTINFTSQLASPIPLPNGKPYLLPYGRGHNIGARCQFQGWNNYRVVRSTSDHMALAINF